MERKELSYKVEGKGLGKINIAAKIFSKSLSLSFAYIFLMLFLFDERSLFINFTNLIYIWIGLVLFDYFVKKKFSYGSRSYYMNDFGIEINDGESNKKYSWDSFSHFYVYDIKTYLGDRRKRIITYKTSGKVFCLRLKDGGLSGIFSKVVVVYSLAENAQEVEGILARNLAQKELRSGEEIFIIDYKFK